MSAAVRPSTDQVAVVLRQVAEVWPNFVWYTKRARRHQLECGRWMAEDAGLSEVIPAAGDLPDGFVTVDPPRAATPSPRRLVFHSTGRRGREVFTVFRPVHRWNPFDWLAALFTRFALRIERGTGR